MMEDLYRIMDDFCSEVHEFNSSTGVGNNHHNKNNNIVTPAIEESDDQIFDDNLFIRTQITSHPRFPSLVSAYIECQKLGAPPEISSFLDEVCRRIKINSSCTDMGTDPELDEFMENYCLFFINYKDELSRPLNKVTTFLANIERQLHQLFNETLTTTVNAIIRHSDEATGSSEEEQSCVDVEASSLNSKTSGATAVHGDQALKEMLLHKYSGCLSHLKTQFLTKKKKGKLPKDSRTVLLDWWNTHYRWPYPTEEEKMKLVEITGLNQKQITNWFINQRKRHWKPSEDQCWALMNGLSDAGDGPSMYFNSTVEGIVRD